MQVAEIAVRFGDTTVDVAHLSTGAYRIGTAADVDLPIVGLTSFPLVDWTERGCMLRVPAGVTARRLDGCRHDGSVLLQPGDEVVLAIGTLAIRVALVGRAAPIDRPRLDARWSGWIAGALAVHLLVLGFAHAFAEPEAEGVDVPSILSMLPARPEPELPAPTVRVARKRDPRERRSATAAQPRTERVASIEPSVEAAPQSEPARRKRAIANARRAGFLTGVRAEDMKAIAGSVDLAKALSDVGPVYREHEAEEKRFGGGRRFDPTKDPRFDSVATGRYGTTGSGRAAGDHHALPGETGRTAPPRLEHCTGACTATGGTTRETIRSVLAQRAQPILDCYDRHGGKARGQVVLEFEIGADGKVVRAYGEGLGNTAGCVASVVRRIAFPQTTGTTATYSMSFVPS